MTLRVALLMMQKNENLLLLPWITYHRNLVDPDSIFIFDNGSTDPHTLAILRDAEESGLSINRAFSEQKHYFEQGIIFANLIKELDRSNPHDFYFPIDCDEFLACDNGGRLSCQKKDIDESLKNLLGSEKVLTIPHKYVNDPYSPNHYSKITHCKKCFFARNACESLALGFHEAKSHTGTAEQDSSITYLEFHYKPYTEHMRMSKQKIQNLVPNLQRQTLVSYTRSRKSNFHAAMALLQSEYDYLRSFENRKHETIRDFNLLQRFAELGIESTQLFEEKNYYSFTNRAKLRVRHEILRSLNSLNSLCCNLRLWVGSIKRHYNS